MPQIQVIGREAVDDQSNQANQQIEREKMTQNAIEKAMQFKQMSEELKLKAKSQESEIEKNRILKLSTRLDYLSKTYDTAAKYENPDTVIQQMLKISGDDVLPTLADPLVRGMTGNLTGQNGQQGQQNPPLTPLGAPWKRTLNELARRRFGLDMQSNDSSGAQSNNSSRVAAANGAIASGIGGDQADSEEPIITGLDESGATLDIPSELRRKNYYSALGTEEAKPYNLEEGKVIASTGSINRAVDALVKLTNKGALKDIMPQTLTDIGNPLLASQASPDTRDALNYMNQLKNLIPFARGGKQLTPYEAKLVFRLLNTQGKTNTQIKRDLDVYKREFNTMVKAISTARGELDLNDLTFNFGGGKSYEDLTSGGKKTKNIMGYDVTY